MRIGFLTTSYPSGADDPRGIHVHRIAAGLVARGVSVIVGAPVDEASTYLLEGVEVRPLRCAASHKGHLASGVSGVIPSLQRRPWLAVEIPGLVSALGAGLADLEDVDLLHCHWIIPTGWVAARKSRATVPVVMTAHGGDMALARRFPPLRRMVLNAAGRANLLIAVSDALKEDLVRFGVPASRVETLPVGVPQAVPIDRSWDHAELRILYVGGLSRRKSVDTLLKALALMDSPAELVVVGSGPLESSLKRLALNLSIDNLSMAGAVPPRKVSAHLQWGDVLVLPSISEGKPTVVMEAMAHGLAVVASDIAGTRELVDHGKTGYLFEPRNPRQLAGYLDDLAADRKLVRHMGAEGREKISEFDLDRVVDRHVEIYGQLLTG